MSKRCFLSTVDNPYNPFDDFTSWLLYDTEKGYNSSGLIGRLARVTDDMTITEENKEIERVIDDIVKYHPRKIYKKVVESSITENTTD